MCGDKDSQSCAYCDVITGCSFSMLSDAVCVDF